MGSRSARHDATLRAACLLLALPLAACNTTGVTDGPDNSIAAPYALSAQQQAVIQDDLKPYLKDPGEAVFGPMLAGQFPNGQILICGYVQAGQFRRWTPYAAYVGGDKVWMGVRGTAATSMCRDRQVMIGDPPG